jgi:YbdK family carboxylate-amine ligase
VAEVAGELACLRGTLAAALDGLGLRAAGAGTHPAAQWQETEIAAGERYQAIHETMRELARREPTFALHVHVGIPDPEQALQALVRLRAHLPALIALSANSPYWQGRDSGMAAVRLPVFGGFPRTGIPRSFADYADYVEAVDVLLRCGAFPEPTFLWWDLRLQPALGTIEVRVMDAQTRIDDVSALTALVQCLVRLEATEGHAPAPARRAARGARREPLPRRPRRDGGRTGRPRRQLPASPSWTSWRSSWRRARRTPRRWAVRRAGRGGGAGPLPGLCAAAGARGRRDGAGRRRPRPRHPRPGRRLRA